MDYQDVILGGTVTAALIGWGAGVQWGAGVGIMAAGVLFAASLALGWLQSRREGR